jgi:hypothetical protein
MTNDYFSHKATKNAEKQFDYLSFNDSTASENRCMDADERRFSGLFVV